MGYFPNSPEFDDIVNIFLGLEYKYSENLIIMAGYRHMPTPVPNQSNRVTNYLDMDKDAITLGCSYSLIKDFITIGVMVEYMQCKDYTVNKDGIIGWAPWNLESDLSPGFTTLHQESYEVEGNVYTTGISAEINF